MKAASVVCALEEPGRGPPGGAGGRRGRGRDAVERGRRKPTPDFEEGRRARAVMSAMGAWALEAVAPAGDPFCALKRRSRILPARQRHRHDPRPNIWFGLRIVAVLDRILARPPFQGRGSEARAAVSSNATGNGWKKTRLYREGRVAGD